MLTHAHAYTHCWRCTDGQLCWLGCGLGVWGVVWHGWRGSKRIRKDDTNVLAPKGINRTISTATAESAPQSQTQPSEDRQQDKEDHWE